MNNQFGSDDSLEEWERDFLQRTENALVVPGNESLFLTRGHILLDHDRHREAVESYYNTLKCDPANEAAYSSLVTAYERVADLARSMDTIIQAFRAGLGILEDVDFRKYPQELFDKLVQAIESKRERIE